MKLRELPIGTKFFGADGRQWIKGMAIRPDPNWYGSGQPVFAAGGFLCEPVGNKSGTSGMQLWYPEAEVTVSEAKRIESR